jgi:hypothetical protein
MNGISRLSVLTYALTGRGVWGHSPIRLKRRVLRGKDPKLPPRRPAFIHTGESYAYKSLIESNMSPFVASRKVE